MTPRGRARGRLGAALLTIACATLTAQTVAAADVPVEEYRVKAALLVNFMKFVQWPHDGALTLCLVGDAPGLDVALAAREANGRQISAVRIRAQDDATKCDVLFISASVGRFTGDVLARLGLAPVLTVGETDPFLSDGGIVRFFVEANRIRFQINAKAADRRGLKISSQLLSLAAR
jgi:hypothetical protein